MDNRPQIKSGMARILKKIEDDPAPNIRVHVAQCTLLRPTGMVSGFWSRCVQSMFRENCSGWSIHYLQDAKGGEIAEGRNAIVASVLAEDRQSPVSRTLWIDDDVLVQPGLSMELLLQDKDIISGVYFTKREGDLSRPLIYRELGSGSDTFRPNAVYPVFGHGMGLCMIRTEVYKRMWAELDLGTDKYGNPQWYRETFKEPPVLLENGVMDTGDTEDMYFLKNAHKLGYQPWIDCRKHAFGFHHQPAKVETDKFGRRKVVQEETGYPQAQYAAWVAGEKISWETPEGMITWD
jgi:hypothetical protein